MSRVNTALGRAGSAHTAQPDFLAQDTALHEYGLALHTSPKRRGSDTAGAAEILWAEFQRLVGEGPAQAGTRPPDHVPAELPRQCSTQRPSRGTPDALDPLSSWAPPTQRELFGTPGLIPAGCRLRQFTAEAARDLMAGWLSSAMVVVPHGTRPALPGAVEQACPRSSVQPLRSGVPALDAQTAQLQRRPDHQLRQHRHGGRRRKRTHGAAGRRAPDRTGQEGTCSHTPATAASPTSPTTAQASPDSARYCLPGASDRNTGTRRTGTCVPSPR